MQHSDSILIVDFGSQVTQLIARRVREAGVYSEIAPFQSADEAFDRIKPAGIILSGGPGSATAENSPRVPQRFFDALRMQGLQVRGLGLPDHYGFEQLPWPEDAPRVVLTVHPSYLLRIPDARKRESEYRRFVADLRLARL